MIHCFKTALKIIKFYCSYLQYCMHTLIPTNRKLINSLYNILYYLKFNYIWDFLIENVLGLLTTLEFG